MNVGKAQRQDSNNINVGEKVCLNLTSLYHGDKQRTLTADNFFSSYDLVTKLYQLNFRYVGTLRKNKKQIPGCFLPSKQKHVFSSIFGFKEEKTLVSYVPKKNKAVILISSEHHSNSVRDDETKKPEIILFYNKTKGSVDAFDQKIEKFTCRRKSNRWPLNVFMFMLDVAAINAAVLYNLKHPDLTNTRLRRRMLEELSCYLIQPSAIQRYNASSLQNHIGFCKRIMMSYHKVIKLDQTASAAAPTNSSSTVYKRCSVSVKETITNTKTSVMTVY